MEDIAPGLLDEIRTSFTEKISNSPKITQLYKAIQDGTATYIEAEEYAYEVGSALAEAFGEHLSAAVLPDGKMYFNIADRVVRPLLEENHAIIADAAAQVQTALNEKAGIGLKAQTVPVDDDRIDGIINKVSASDNYDDVAWVLDEPVKTYSQAVVDETLRANVDFQGKAGRNPRIIRKAERKCCEWCRMLAGEYDYLELYDLDDPREVYRRHENCRCTVEYDPGDGTRTNVHTKKLTQAGQSDTIEESRKNALSNLGTFRPNDYHSTIQEFVGLNRDDVFAAAKNGKRHSGVYTDAMGKTRQQLQRSIINRVSQVERHADKIRHPELYVSDWATRDSRYQAGLIRKWEKDMRRNAEQAEIELAVFEGRF